jgi:pimeloyl-ACP methyl ester carboxylesterase
MTTRRTLLASAAVAPILASPLGSFPKASAQDKRGTFVLVPGQWTGAFIWHTVAPILREAGHDVYPVTCTGLGDRVHLSNAAIDLDTFVTDVVNVLEYEDLHDVTLVGHSFGGMVITGVAEVVPERLKQLVYFDTAVPADGENDYNLDYGSGEAYAEAVAADIAGAMEAGLPGFVPVFPAVVEWVQSMVTDPDEAEWFIAKLMPHPQLTRLQPVRLGNPAAAKLSRAFILCTADKDLTANPQTNTVVLAAERARSDPNWRVLELNNNHAVPLNDPKGTAEVLISLL